MAHLASTGSQALSVTTLLLALLLLCAASAGWGDENWDEMVWGGAAPPIPLVPVEGIAVLAAFLLGFSYWLLNARRRRAATLVLGFAALFFVSSVPVSSTEARADAAAINAAYGRAIDAMKADNFEQASDAMAEALALAEAESKGDAGQIGVLAYGLGRIQLKLGRFEAARGSLEKAVELNSAIHGRQSPELVDSLEQLGGCLEKLRDFRAAYLAYDRIADIKAKEFGKSSAEVADALHSLARVASSNGKHSKAIRILERAKRIWKEERGAESFEVGVAMVFIGLSELALQRYSSAGRHLAHGIETIEKALPDGHPIKILMYARTEAVLKQTRTLFSTSGVLRLQEVQARLARNRAAAQSVSAEPLHIPGIAGSIP